MYETKIEKVIEDNSNSYDGLLNGVTIGAIIVSVVMGGSISSLTSLIRNFTLISIIILVDVEHPPHAETILQIAVKLSEFDIINSNKLNEYLFEFRKTLPFSEVFERYGVED